MDLVKKDKKFWQPQVFILPLRYQNEQDLKDEPKPETLWSNYEKNSILYIIDSHFISTFVAMYIPYILCLSVHISSFQHIVFSVYMCCI